MAPVLSFCALKNPKCKDSNSEIGEHLPLLKKLNFVHIRPPLSSSLEQTCEEYMQSSYISWRKFFGTKQISHKICPNSWEIINKMISCKQKKSRGRGKGKESKTVKTEHFFKIVESGSEVKLSVFHSENVILILHKGVLVASDVNHNSNNNS